MHWRGDEVVWHWYEHFRHVNMVTLWKLAQEELVRGLLEIDHVKQLCEACQVKKQ
jgi:hypothetical protein